MLTNGFTRDELAACAPATTITCTKTVVMSRSTNVAFTAGQKYAVASIQDPFMVAKDDNDKDHLLDGLFFREHFTIDKPRQVVHLSETGLNAGRRFCGAARDDGNRSVHAVYAPLDALEFRTTVCEACLKIWALEAYDEGSSMPEYIAEIRASHKAAAVYVPAAGAPAPQLALEMQ